MTQTIRIEIPAAPPSANRIWELGKGRAHVSKAATAFYTLTCYALGGRVLPSSWEAVNVSILVAPTQRSGDVDNKIKPVLDALTRARFWQDDRIVAYVSCEFLPPEKRGRTVVYIERAVAKFAAVDPAK